MEKFYIYLDTLGVEAMKSAPHFKSLEELEEWVLHNPAEVGGYANELLEDQGANEFVVAPMPNDSPERPYKFQPDALSRSAKDALYSRYEAAIPTHLQKKKSQQSPLDDNGILRVVSGALYQAESWADVYAEQFGFKMLGALSGGGNADRKAVELIDQIYRDKEKEEYWETTVWAVPHSDLGQGYSVVANLGTFAAIAGPDGTLYSSESPTRPKSSYFDGKASVRDFSLPGGPEFPFPPTGRLSYRWMEIRVVRCAQRVLSPFAKRKVCRPVQ